MQIKLSYIAELDSLKEIELNMCNFYEKDVFHCCIYLTKYKERKKLKLYNASAVDWHSISMGYIFVITEC